MPQPPPAPHGRVGAFLRRHERAAWLAVGLVIALTAVGGYALFAPSARPLTQRDIDAAVLHTLKKQPPAPSPASVAYGVIAPSIVLVRRLGPEDETSGQDGGKAKPKNSPKSDPDERGTKKNDKSAKDERKEELRGLGTGVVFADSGLIFTCLHVIAGAERIGVTFGDGTESEVEVVSVQPENDLAVLRAKTVPDDLVPATLRSTRGLKVGDEVVAVGFPFGIGPSASAGVVSGLRREHFSEEGQRNLIDLIQFDAAANPGNSGGPLVTIDGDVVGIVTSILNPTDEGFFVGIGFAVPIENAASGAGFSPF
jgi:S1-C subfamily serine protease